MASQIDFAIALGLFFTFIAVLLVYLVNFLTSYTAISSTSELRTTAYNIFTSFFSDKGIPRNWTEGGNSPLKIGLVTDMYRIPIVVAENSSVNRRLVTLNLSLNFDLNCDKKAWNTTVRIINGSNVEIPFQIYNQTYCSQQFLKAADVVFNNSFNANEAKNFSIYFSQDKNITNANYSLTFPSFVNFTFTIYPEEKLTVISAEKLLALKKLNYSDVLNTLSKEYYFNLEISE